jgi:L-iditol 2-dehydrogenase
VRAAVLYGKEEIRIKELRPRALKAGEVRLRIEAALTCGTDLKVFKRGYHANMIVPPAVFGHEMAGVIAEVGPGARGWRKGDRVVAANSAPCGECFYCRSGAENLCEDLLFLNGAYAESIVVPERVAKKNMLRLKPATGFCDAALVEPLACVAQGIEDTGLRAGQHVLVIGAGPIGLMFVTLARHLGCEATVAGRHKARLAAAHRLGAGRVIDIGDGRGLAKKIKAGATSPFDAVIEAVGKPETWEASVELARKGGTVNFFGGCPSGAKVTLDATRIHYSNLTLRASFHHTPRAVRRALEFIEAGVVRANDFVDGECPLSELPKLFQRMAVGNQAVKTRIRVRD